MILFSCTFTQYFVNDSGATENTERKKNDETLVLILLSEEKVIYN